MKNWKKNAVVASILVFVCAGIYLNWMYTQDQETANLTDTLNEEKILGNSTLVMSQTGSLAADAAKEDLQAASGQTTDYFAAVRLSRQQSRDSAVSTLQEAMSYGEDAQASSASKELEGLVETALCEAQIESLVIAKGYTDCVAYMNDGGISVAVAAPEEGGPGPGGYPYCGGKIRRWAEGTGSLPPFSWYGRKSTVVFSWNCGRIR